ncbi:MAG: Holliday junction resolvase RuvX [Pseudomonadota bacterium]
MRILCLDIGKHRIGVAVSDQMGWSAQGVSVIERKGWAKDLKQIADYCREYEVENILIGLPTATDGSEGKAALLVRDFAKRLEEKLKEDSFSIPLEFWDESYSTVNAHEILIKAGFGRKRRKKVVDKIAAVNILTDYLENNRG